MPRTLTVTDAKARLTELVAAVATTHDRFEITRNGEPAAVLVSHAEIAALEETVAVLSDAAVQRDLLEAEADIRSGNLTDAAVVHENLRRG